MNAAAVHSITSPGGAGTFDSIFLIGIVAVYQDVAPSDIPEVAHPAHEFLAEGIVVRGPRPDVPDTRRLAPLLRPRRKWPRRCRAQQFPPSDGDCHTPLPCEGA